jgi:type 1 glutamine amidotransferase
MPRTALVLVGHAPFTDPWHDDAAVGHLVALELAAAGLEPVLRGTMPWALDEFDPADLALLVVKAAGGTPEDDAFDAFQERLAAILAAGIPVLALHQASGAFGGAYSAAAGGRWGGRSWHPPIQDTTFRAVDDEHPVSAGLAPFSAYDEGYADLDLDEGIRPLVVTEYDGVAHPVVWQGPGASRVIVDTLGHDARSFASAGRVDLLRREIAWLTAS